MQLSRLEALHAAGFIHRDLNFHNFVMGTGRTAGRLYLIDFGLAELYRTPRTHQHIPYRRNVPFVGTPYFASINAHMGAQLSRRDDLESLGYMCVRMLAGRLPWEDAEEERSFTQCVHDVGCAKMSMMPQTLCRDLPNEVLSYMRRVRALKFSETPDYQSFRQLFRKRFKKEKFSWDLEYDWTP